MGRWEPDARGRLAQAALELYAERGFEQTTVADIAERAGLSERTFFRHYSDKREVLFTTQEEFERLFLTGLEAAPEGALPLEAVATALRSVAAVFEPRRPWSLVRQGVIDANPALQERESLKLNGVARSLTAALLERGVTEPTASLTAQAGMAVFHVSFQRWIAPENTRTLGDVMDEALAALKAAAAA
jgi:AcrR family transcriptional regulator